VNRFPSTASSLQADLSPLVVSQATLSIVLSYFMKRSNLTKTRPQASCSSRSASRISNRLSPAFSHVAGQRKKEAVTHRSIQPVVNCPGRWVQQVVRMMVDSYTISRVSPRGNGSKNIIPPNPEIAPTSA